MYLRCLLVYMYKSSNKLNFIKQFKSALNNKNKWLSFNKANQNLLKPFNYFY